MKKSRFAALGLAAGIVAGGSDALADPASPALSVSFVLQPVVGEKPPVLAVTLRNSSKQAMEYGHFFTAPCFVNFLLKLEIKRPDGTPMDIKPCVVKAWPGVYASLGAGRSERMLVPFAELADAWPLGTYSIDVDWNPTALEEARGLKIPRALQTSINETEFTIAKPLTKLRIRRGETAKLPDGVLFTFAGHGHKDVMRGETSPLIISGSIKTNPAGSAEAFSVNLHPEQDRLLRVGDDRVFEVVNYAYGDWMELRYYGRIASPTR